MMITQTEQILSDFLLHLAEELDIPPSKYEQAIERYKAVGDWLARVDSSLGVYCPQVYPQGSFQLGTVIRPLKDGKESGYDIDLVCQLSRQKLHTQEYDIKHCVKDRLKEHKTYERMLNDDEGHRCWTLNYAEEDGIGFHMDCLPCVPEDDNTKQGLVLLGVPYQYAQYAIAITHTDDFEDYEWLSSNPRGYADWFENLNQPVFLRVVEEQKQGLFEKARTIYACVDEVPDGLVRTPLQRAIQILKRHRDRWFVRHAWEEQKPISIIITTLAALSYENETDIYTTLSKLVNKIENFSQTNLIQRINGEWRIPNPVDPAENFADRWNEAGSKRADAFFLWIDWLKEDVTNAANADSREGIVTALSKGFDKTVLEKAAERFDSGQLIKAANDGVPTLAGYSHRQDPSWPISLQYKVTVKGNVHKRIREPRKLWELTNRAQPKNLGLRFKAETNVPQPYEVKWQVVNTGKDAALANGLRGDFDKGEGLCGTVRWEYTHYRGTHWIEAFVIKNGICVARSGPKYVRVK